MPNPAPIKAHPNDPGEGEPQGEPQLQGTPQGGMPDGEGGTPQGGEPTPKPSGPEFFPSGEVPPELKEVYARMHASYTQAMQGISSSERKAEILDRLMEDEDFRDYWESRGKGEEPGEGVQPARGELPNMEDLPPAAQDIFRRLQHLEEKVSRSEVATELREARQRHEDLADYLPQMVDIQKRYPGLSTEDSYYLAKRPDIEKKMKELQEASVKENLEGKKKAQVEGAGIEGPTGKPTPPVKSFKEALSQELKNRGLSSIREAEIS